MATAKGKSAVDVTFADDDLDRLEADQKAKTRLPRAVVRAYWRIMVLIRGAIDERDIIGVIGPKNFYRLKGDRAHQHAMRLNDQWRLIVEIVKGNPKNTVRVVSIEDYH